MAVSNLILSEKEYASCSESICELLSVPPPPPPAVSLQETAGNASGVETRPSEQFPSSGDNTELLVDSNLTKSSINNGGIYNATESKGINGSNVRTTSTTENVIQNMFNVDFKPLEEEKKYPEDGLILSDSEVVDASCVNNPVSTRSTIVPRQVEQSGVRQSNNTKAATLEEVRLPSPEVLGHDTAERPVTSAETRQDLAVKDAMRTDGRTDTAERPVTRTEKGQDGTVNDAVRTDVSTETAEHHVTRTEKGQDGTMKDAVRTDGSTDTPSNNTKEGKT